MRRWLLRGITSFVLAGLLLLPAAVFAQGDSSESSGPAGPNYVIPTAVAVLITIIVMALVCMPSRKGSQ